MIELVAMGVNTDHMPGETRRHSDGMPHYVFIQMLTPGFVSVSSGIRRIEPYECVLYPPRSPRNLSPQDEESSFRNNAAYIQNWLKALKNDKRFVVSAAGKADKAVTFILG